MTNVVNFPKQDDLMSLDEIFAELEIDFDPLPSFDAQKHVDKYRKARSNLNAETRRSQFKVVGDES